MTFFTSDLVYFCFKFSNKKIMFEFFFKIPFKKYKNTKKSNPPPEMAAG